MTARAPGRQEADRVRYPWRRPFSVLDELNCYFDSPAEPNNVHLEVWLPGHLSPEGLRAGVASVLADVPRVSVRRGRAAWWRSGSRWEFPAAPDRDPVSVAGWQTDAELDAARCRFLATAPALDRSPAFRLLLARGPQWDSLILNAHHAAFDGRSCVLLLRLIAERYRASGRSAEPAPDGDDLTGRRSAAKMRPAAVRPATEGTRPAAKEARRAPLARWRTARIAPQHSACGQGASRQGASPPGTGAAGYGFTLLDWPGIPPRSPLAARSRVTVNDLLIAALAETVSRWNTERGQRSGYIRISMPIDDRAPGHDQEIGNLSRLATVTVDSRPTAGRAEIAAAVAEQTRLAKDRPGAPISPVLAAVARAPLPIPAKRLLIRLALRWLGSVACDTSLLSNLGRIGDPPAFGTLVPARMWFSTSTRMPRGLAVGAITVDGRLHLCFRYRKALFDDAAGDAFAAAYADALAALSPSVGVSPADASPRTSRPAPAGAKASR